MATVVPPESLPPLCLTPEYLPKVDHLVTEDDTPVDYLFAERQQKLLTEPLDSSWAGPPTGGNFLAVANVGLYFGLKQPPLVPDVLLSGNVALPADIWAKSGRSYFVWEYGKPPDAAVEIVSDTRGGEDGYKMQQYARGGVPYYVIWDPAHYLSEESLRVFALHEGAYVRLEQPWLSGVGLGLTIWHGQYAGIEADWLRWCDQNGQVIPTGKERAEQERQRAEQERLAKEEAVRRAELLAARLRALGIDPEA